ncbi:MAG: hypothetical protein MJ070_08145 [Lachnospiraceae bacterium]|nr:hypothetical protein [Lachnospiraceae bacterium]
MANGTELKKLNRRELLEILLEQEKEITQLRADLGKARADLLDRTVKTEHAGTLAEAVLSLNGVYEGVEKAAAQYLENIRQRDEESRTLLETAKRESEAILEDARKQASAIVKDAKVKRQAKLNETYEYLRTVEQKVNEFYSAHPEAAGDGTLTVPEAEERDEV